MFSFIKSWLAVAATLWLLSLLPPVIFTTWVSLALTATVLWIAFSLIKPLLKILLIPFNLLTFGLAGSLVNIGFFYIALYLVPGFNILPFTFYGQFVSQFFAVVSFSILFALLRGILAQTVFRR